MQALLSHSGYEFVVVKPGEAKDLRIQFESLRYRVFVEYEGWEEPNSARLETDDLDRFSPYILALCNGRVVSGCRLIDGTQVCLPVASATSQPIAPRSFEISRMTTQLDERGEAVRKMLHALLYIAMYRYVFELCGHNVVYSHIRACFLRKLRRSFGEGFFTPIDEPALHQKRAKKLWLVPVVGDAYSLGFAVAAMKTSFFPRMEERTVAPRSWVGSGALVLA